MKDKKAFAIPTALMHSERGKRVGGIIKQTQKRNL